MTALAQLKLTQYTKPTAANPAQQRRSKLIRRLREQIQLASAELQGTAHSIVRNRTVTDKETGYRRTVAVPKRVKAWWVGGDGGKLVLTVRYGSRLLEFAKGKSAVEVPDSHQLVPTLQLLCDAVAAGELDAQIEAASNKLRSGFKK